MIITRRKLNSCFYLLEKENYSIYSIVVKEALEVTGGVWPDFPPVFILPKLLPKNGKVAMVLSGLSGYNGMKNIAFEHDNYEHTFTSIMSREDQLKNEEIEIFGFTT